MIESNRSPSSTVVGQQLARQDHQTYKKPIVERRECLGIRTLGMTIPLTEVR